MILKKIFQSGQQTFVDFPPKKAATVSNALNNMQLQITAQSLMILVARFFFQCRLQDTVLLKHTVVLYTFSPTTYKLHC